MADAVDLKSTGSNPVPVRVRPPVGTVNYGEFGQGELRLCPGALPVNSPSVLDGPLCENILMRPKNQLNSSLPCTFVTKRIGHTRFLPALIVLVLGVGVVTSCEKGPKPSEIVSLLIPELTKHADTDVKRTETEDTSSVGVPIKVITLKYDTASTPYDLRESLNNFLLQNSFRQSINVNAPASFMQQYISEDGKITIKILVGQSETAISMHEYAEKIKKGEIERDEQGNIPPPIQNSVEITISHTLK